MAPYQIRVFGDPVLKQVAKEITNVDGALVKLAEDMLVTMYDAPGVGLAAPQVGVQKRLFVYDFGDGPAVLVNPVLKESDGEWLYEEGCLSVPGLSWEIVRPNRVHVVGYDLDGNDVDLEVQEFAGRLFQHEFDHLDGKLLLDYLDDEQRRDAMKVLRERAMNMPEPEPAPPKRRGLSFR